MKTMIAATLLALTMTAGAQERSGQYWTGNKLLRDCEKPQGDIGHAFCMGYVTAVADANRHDKDICIPQGVTIGQLVAVATQSLRNFPTTRHMDADVLLQAAFGVAWPCQQQPATRQPSSRNAL